MVSGENFINVDVVNNLEQHSDSSRTTYAYYFTELLDVSPRHRIWPTPDWAKSMADHAEEQPFVFGFPFLDSDTPLWRGKGYIYHYMNFGATVKKIKLDFGVINIPQGTLSDFRSI